MLRSIQSQIADEAELREGGFTLIELMVVVLVMGILLAIAVPTYLGMRSRAQDRAAQQAARTAVQTAAGIFSDTGSYTAAGTSASMAAKEPSYGYAATTSSGVTVVGIAAPDANTFNAAVKSASGTCFQIKYSTTGGQVYGSSSAATCVTDNTIVGTSW